jgi:Cu/Ag efflux pump CusA
MSVEGTPLRLGDITKVVEEHQPLIGDAVIDDAPGIMLVVEKFPWANTLEVTRGVEATLKALKMGLPGLVMDSSLYRPANFIEMAMDNLFLSMSISCILVILALGALVYDWRSALISLVAIALSLLAAALVLYLRGATINMMVFAGLLVAFAAVYDDAIVDVDNIKRRLRQHRKEGGKKSTARVILEASFEIRRVIAYATVIAVLGATPILFLEGVSLAFFKPLALSFMLALIVSMLVALTVTPALSMMLLPKAPLESRESPVLGWLRNGYDAVFPKIVQKPGMTFFGVCVVMLIGFLAFLTIFRIPSLLPDFRERDLVIRWEATPSVSRPAMNRMVTKASRELRAIPGVRNVSAHVGRAIMSDEVVDISNGELWVSIDPAVDYDATLASIQQVVNGYPGLAADVQTYLKQRFKAGLSGKDDSVVVRIYGEDLKVLRSKAEEVKKVLAKIAGIVDPQVEIQVEQPNLEIEVDIARAEEHGIKPGDVRRAAAILLSGIEVGNLFEEQKVFDVVVFGSPETRSSLTDIRNLLIDTPAGGHVRLADVADVRMKPVPNVIKRETVSRYIDVGAGVSGRGLNPVLGDIEGRLQEMEFPLEYRAEVLGEAAEKAAAQNRVIAFAVAAAIGIFLLLQACFRSWGLALISFFTLPMALVGGVLMAPLYNGWVSLGSLIGFLTVLSIAVRNTVMLIKHYHHLEEHEDESFGPEVVLRGTRERFAPIVTTAATTIVALLPLMLLGQIAGHEIVHPMSLVIFGGLITSTLFSLFGVPALYLLFGARREAELEVLPVTVVDEEVIYVGK